MRPSVFSDCLGVPCRISPGHGCAAAEITSTFARVLAHPGSGCSRVALPARLTSPVFAQVANDGQRGFVVQIKREGFGLVLLWCGFRVHVLGCGRAASWTEPDHGRAAARETYLRGSVAFSRFFSTSETASAVYGLSLSVKEPPSVTTSATAATGTVTTPTAALPVIRAFQTYDPQKTERPHPDG